MSSGCLASLVHHSNLQFRTQELFHFFRGQFHSLASWWRRHSQWSMNEFLVAHDHVGARIFLEFFIWFVALAFIRGVLGLHALRMTFHGRMPLSEEQVALSLARKSKRQGAAPIVPAQSEKGSFLVRDWVNTRDAFDVKNKRIKVMTWNVS
jgi:hypothetical protein